MTDRNRPTEPEPERGIVGELARVTAENAELRAKNRKLATETWAELTAERDALLEAATGALAVIERAMDADTDRDWFKLDAAESLRAAIAKAEERNEPEPR